MAEPDCTCGRTGLHSITCMVEAATQPHAMIDDHGGVYYPDNAEDAAWFAEMQGARFLNPTAALAVFVPTTEGDTREQ